MEMGQHGWAQANTDTQDNPELDQPGGAYGQLKHRALGTLTAFILLALVVVVLGVLAD